MSDDEFSNAGRLSKRMQELADDARANCNDGSRTVLKGARPPRKALYPPLAFG